MSFLLLSTRFRHRWLPWLRGFAPSFVAPRGRERFRACVGALVGIAVTALAGHLLPGGARDIPFLVAPMGASAVLLFAVPASPLAQPWSILGGNLIAATVGVACAHWIPDPVTAASCAVALAIGAMFALRCVHPPSGAVALTAVLGGPAVHALGLRFVLTPIALQSTALLGAALVYHALTGHRYPHAATTARDSTTRADLTEALRARSEWLDVAPDDLASLLHDLEMKRYVRRFDALTCADIMSRDVVSVRADTPAHVALALLDLHRIKALPVTDASHSVIGIVTRANLTRRAGGPLARLANRRAGPVRATMSTPVRTAHARASLAELVPLFAAHGHHHIPIVEDGARLVGIVTQADLIAGLYRRTPRHAATTNAMQGTAQSV